MTLAELLDKARLLIAANKTAFVEPKTLELAQAIVDILGSAQPCGYPDPEFVSNGVGELLVRIGGPFAVSPTELRELCAMWLRAADEAEANSVG